MRIAIVILLLPLAGLARAETPAESLKLLDERLTFRFDFRAETLIEHIQAKQNPVVFKIEAFRRDASQAALLLTVAPKAEQGSGYLMIGKNLWYYDPRIGKWERRTLRERLLGTNSNPEDVGGSTLAKDFDAVSAGEGRLGKYNAIMLKLTKKKNARTAYPVIRLWIDKASRMILKRQDFAASGKLLRTSYTTRWGVLKSGAQEMYYAAEARVFDEVIKGSVTTVKVLKANAEKMPANLFTKAWLESKSR